MHATLKNWEWPGDKASILYHLIYHAASAYQDKLLYIHRQWAKPYASYTPDRFHHTLHHNYLITIEKKIVTGDVMNNLETTSRVPHEKYCTALLYAAIIRTRTHRQTAHAPYTHILGRAA